mgnify:FL=1
MTIELSDIEKAKKAIAAKKTNPPMMELRIQTNYGERLLIPFAEGLTVMEAMSKAEIVKIAWDNDIPEFRPLSGNDFSIELLSCEKYEQMKIAAVMRRTVPQIHEAMKNSDNS